MTANGWLSYANAKGVITMSKMLSAFKSWLLEPSPKLTDFESFSRECINRRIVVSPSVREKAQQTDFHVIGDSLKIIEVKPSEIGLDIFDPHMEAKVAEIGLETLPLLGVLHARVELDNKQHVNSVIVVPIKGGAKLYLIRREAHCYLLDDTVYPMDLLGQFNLFFTE